MFLQKTIVTIAVLAMGIDQLASAKRKHTELLLNLWATNSCEFWAEADRDSSWSGLKRVKVKGAVKFQHGDSILENYPDEIRLHVTYGSVLDDPFANQHRCATSFDPAHLQLKASWNTKGMETPARGALLNSEWHPPRAWCETTCHDYWTYEIRIDSANIPITSELTLTLHTQDGKVISSLVGKLNAVEVPDRTTSPSP